VGKQSKLKQSRKKQRRSDDASYLNLDSNSAFDLRCKVANMHLSLLPREESSAMLKLPSSFFKSFYSLLGHVLVGARHWEFWDEISTNLIAITSGQENQHALAAWNHGDKAEIKSNPRIFCFNILQKFPDMFSPMRLKTCRQEILRHGLDSEKIWYQEGIPHHVGICGTVAGGGSLHTAGTLHLLDAGFGRKCDHELWLARLRPDGIYATSQLGKIGNLKVSEIKSMQKYIVNYSGIPLSGKLETMQGDEARRICKLLGMTIEGQFAWIGK
jgi:hypothetical protein